MGLLSVSPGAKGFGLSHGMLLPEPRERREPRGGWRVSCSLDVWDLIRPRRTFFLSVLPRVTLGGRNVVLTCSGGVVFFYCMGPCVPWEASVGIQFGRPACCRSFLALFPKGPEGISNFYLFLSRKWDEDKEHYSKVRSYLVKGPEPLKEGRWPTYPTTSCRGRRDPTHAQTRTNTSTDKEGRRRPRPTQAKLARLRLRDLQAKPSVRRKGATCHGWSLAKGTQTGPRSVRIRPVPRPNGRTSYQ